MDDGDSIFDHKTGTWVDRYRTFQGLPSNTQPYTPSEARAAQAALGDWLSAHKLDISLASTLWDQIRPKAGWAILMCEIERAAADPDVPKAWKAKVSNPNQHKDLLEELTTGEHRMPAKERRRFLSSLKKRQPAEDVAIRDAFIADVVRILFDVTGETPGVSSSAQSSGAEYTGPGLRLFRALLRPFGENISDGHLRDLIRTARNQLKTHDF